jgi:hypothetical protein
MEAEDPPRAPVHEPMPPDTKVYVTAKDNERCAHSGILTWPLLTYVCAVYVQLRRKCTCALLKR